MIFKPGDRVISLGGNYIEVGTHGIVIAVNYSHNRVHPYIAVSWHGKTNGHNIPIDNGELRDSKYNNSIWNVYDNTIKLDSMEIIYI